MKRLLSWIMMFTMLFSLTACGGKNANAGEKIAEAIQSSKNYLYDRTQDPVCGSVGGDWVALGFARGDTDVPVEWFDRYYAAVETYVKSCDGVLHDRKYTEYSRVILALTAIGKDPANVAGYNLLTPLADFEQTVFQGINGPIFALLALDSGKYEVPENTADSTQATRDMYVDYIINAQLSDGGWSLMGGEVEIDLTAMALQALAKYQDRKDVAEAVEKGLHILSDRQNENGGYPYSAAEQTSCESVAQVIVALAELGISLDDSRFVKNGKTLLDGLLQFRQADGGFSHLIDGETDLLATEQAFYALVAANRVSQGEASLYRMK